MRGRKPSRGVLTDTAWCLLRGRSIFARHYNRANFMQSLSGPARLTALLVLAVCVVTAGSAVRGQGSTQGDFSRAAATAIAHGKRAEAEHLAAARGAADPAAAAVLAQLAAHRGKYKDAVAQLEPVAAREPGGEAALQL